MHTCVNLSFHTFHLLISQALRNLVSKSRQRIAAIYGEVDTILKSGKKAQQQRNQDEYSQNTGQVVEATQEKMRMMRRSEGFLENEREQK